MKRKPKREYSTKIPGRSVPEISGPYELEVSRQSGVRMVRFFETKVTAEAITNAVMLYFMENPQSERDVILDEYLAKLETLLALDES